jgi:hypothetical protein
LSKISKHGTKRTLSEASILDMISNSKKSKVAIPLDQLKRAKRQAECMTCIKTNYIHFNNLFFTLINLNGKYFRQKLYRCTTRKQLQRLRDEIQITCKYNNIEIPLNIRRSKYHHYIEDDRYIECEKVFLSTVKFSDFTNQ